MRPDNKQYGLIHLLLKNLGWDKAAKEELVCSYTKDDKLTSLKDLTWDQASDLITFLKAQVAKKTEDDQTPDDKALWSARRRVLAVAHQLGWHEMKDGVVVLHRVKGEMKPKADYQRISAYCETHCAARKGFWAMTAKELRAVAVQFDLMLVSYTKTPPKR